MLSCSIHTLFFWDTLYLIILFFVFKQRLSENPKYVCLRVLTELFLRAWLETLKSVGISGMRTFLITHLLSKFCNVLLYFNNRGADTLREGKL